MIFAASILSALKINKYYDRSAEVTEGILSLLKYIKMKIELNRAPLDDILKSFECSALEGEGILKEARERGLMSALEYTMDLRLIDRNEYRILKSFTEMLGKGLFEGEKERCALCIKSYGLAANEKRSALQKKKKIALAVAASFAALIIIMLI